VSLHEEANSDHELMDRAAGGDAQAFRLLFERYKVPIYSYLYSIVHDRQVAEELAQETFLRVFRSRNEYSRGAKFSTWLWTIARNGAIDHLRKKKEQLSDAMEEFSGGDLQDVEPTDAETLLVEKANQEQLEACLKGLPESQREAMALRIFSELSYEEISESVKATVAAVKSVLHRARTALVNCLQAKLS